MAAIAAGTCVSSRYVVELTPSFRPSSIITFCPVRSKCSSHFGTNCCLNLFHVSQVTLPCLRDSVSCFLQLYDNRSILLMANVTEQERWQHAVGYERPNCSLGHVSHYLIVFACDCRVYGAVSAVESTVSVILSSFITVFPLELAVYIGSRNVVPAESFPYLNSTVTGINLDTDPAMIVAETNNDGAVVGISLQVLLNV